MLTVIVVRSVEDRYRGFLRSCMLEVSAGVFVSTSLNKGARLRVWEVLSEWHSKLRNGSLILITGNREGVKLETLGEPIKQIVDIDGILVTLNHM